MPDPTPDPLISEIRTAREKHAARFGYDLTEIFRDIKARQQASGRTYVRYPSRPATPVICTPDQLMGDDHGS